MTLSRLKWITIVTALVFLGLYELLRRKLPPASLSWRGEALLAAALLAGCILFFSALFSLIARLQGRLIRSNNELLALHAAASDIYGELSLEAILQKVVEQSRQLIGTRYGALSVVDERGRIQNFMTTGIEPHLRARIGDPPIGRGLLGVPLHDGRSLRLREITQDPRSVGFPPEHPVLHSLLAVPIVCKGPFRGNLYLSEKNEGTPFGTEDEESLSRFAVAASIAIDSAYLHHQLQSLAIAEERLKIAHDIHDGVAQVLAYVNTKAQAIKELLSAGRAEVAERQLDQLAAAARDEYSEVRESIVGLRAASVPGRSLAEILTEYVAHWQELNHIRCELRLDRLPPLHPHAELQVLGIVQEALANVRKHSRASRVDVLIEITGTNLRLSIEDDGRGFDAFDLGRSDFPRFGLSTMRERAESLGGKLRLDSVPGRGTWVLVEIPIAATTMSRGVVPKEVAS